MSRFDVLAHAGRAREIFSIIARNGFEDLQEIVGVAASRITLGVTIGSLIVGSSLIVTTGAGPRLLGYPALGSSDT